MQASARTHRRIWAIVIGIIALCLIAAMAMIVSLYSAQPGVRLGPDAEQLPRLPATADAAAHGWPTYGGQAGGTKYSALSQINRNNVDRLKVAWIFHTGDVRQRSPDSHPTTSEMTPILANGKLYTCTPLNSVIALDPGTGKQIWRFHFNKRPEETVNPVYNCRGVSYWQASDPREAQQPCGKRILEGTDSGYLLALDADTGRLCPQFGDKGRIDLNALDYGGEGRVSLISPPAIYRDVAIVGGTIADNRYLDTRDGIVRGFDIRTGKQVWQWNPIPEALTKVTGGANSWGAMSVDLKRGWVFLPTGSPSYDIYGANRNISVPDGNAVVVLDALTGRKIWSYQVVHHDLWDYDLAAMPTLATIRQGGRMVDAVLQATKTGFLFTLDRQTGKPLFPVVERPMPKSDIPGEHAAATQPIPVLPEPLSGQRLDARDAWGALLFDKAQCRKQIAALRNEGAFTPPSTKGSLLYPAFLGGTNWGGLAYDPNSGIAIMNSLDIPMAVKLIPRAQFDRKRDAPKGTSVYKMEGSPYIATRRVLLSPLGAPCNPPPWGRLTAIDMSTGKTLWKVPFGRTPLSGGLPSPAMWGAPTQGGPIVTAGSLIFIGASLDSKVRAFDLATGRELWSADTGVPATATPMTYAFGPDKRQYVVIAAGGHASLETKLGDAIIAYSLK